MTRKDLAALAFFAIYALAPLNAARAGEVEKSPAPPAPHTKGEDKVPAPPAGAEGPKAPPDPKIAALVKALEDPEDHEKRAKAFDALLALGEPGVAAIRESLSCRGAKIVIESTVTPPAAPPNTPIKVEFRMKNAGTGTLWVPNIPADKNFFNASRKSAVQPYGDGRPSAQGKLGGGGGGHYGHKAQEANHPLDHWKPIRHGAAVCSKRDVQMLRTLGMQELTVTSSLTAGGGKNDTYPATLAATERGTGKAVTFQLGSRLTKEDTQEDCSSKQYAVPDLENLPAHGVIKFEVKPAVLELPANESHLECIVTLGNTKEAGALLYEQNLGDYAWYAWLDERNVPVRSGSLGADTTSRPPTTRFAKRVEPQQALTWQLNLQRPEKPGAYRLLVGYEVEPGGEEFDQNLPPKFEETIDETEDAEKVVHARAFAHSEPIKIPTIFKADYPVPLEGEPAEALPDEPLSMRMIKARFGATLFDAKDLHARLHEILPAFAMHARLRPALIYARALSDTDPLRLQIYYHCGLAFLKKTAYVSRPFSSPYTEFCLQQARRISKATLHESDGLRTGSRIAWAHWLVLNEKYDEASQELDGVQKIVEPLKDGMPWDWCTINLLRIQLLSKSGKYKEAVQIFNDHWPWCAKELGPDNDAELELLAAMRDAAKEAKDSKQAETLDLRHGQAIGRRKSLPFAPLELTNKLAKEAGQLEKAGELDKAEEALQKAYWMSTYVSSFDVYENVASVRSFKFYEKHRMPGKAVKFSIRNLVFAERQSNRNPAVIAYTLCELGQCYLESKQVEEARAALARAEETLSKSKMTESVIAGKVQELKQALPKE